MATREREKFLEQVKKAAAVPVSSHIHDAEPPEPEPGRALVGDALADVFTERAEATGMTVARVSSNDEALRAASSWLEGRGLTEALAWDVPELRELSERLPGITITWWDPTSAARKDDAFAMKCGITTVDYAVAETGSLVVSGGAETGRSVTMLGEYHLAIVRASQILPDLYDLFPKLEEDYPDGLPPCISLVTGPSKTADIELQLVVGVHGPGEVHVVLIEE